MRSIKISIEQQFESFGLWVFDNRIKTIFLVMLVAVGLMSQLPKISVDTSNEGFLHKQDPILVSYEKFREQFGRDEVIIVAVKTSEIFDQKFIKKLTALHHELEKNIPHLDDIDSLVNARNTHGKADKIIVEDLFEEIPKTADAMQVKKAFALNHNLYKNFILSENANFTTVIVRPHAYSNLDVDSGNLSEGFDRTVSSTDSRNNKFLSDAENSQLVNKTREIIQKYHSDNFQIFMAGSPVVVDAIKRAMQRDMKMYVKVSLFVILIVLFAFFRRLSGVFLPLLVVVLSLLSTLSLMAWNGVAIKPPTQILPLFLLAVGVAASVHLLAIFFRQFNEYGDKRGAIAYSLGHSGLAVAMTGLTTAAGLLSFSMSEVAPIADLGLFAAIGVMISLFYTLVLVPSLIAILPLKQKEDVSSKARMSKMDAVLLKIATVGTTRSTLVIGVATVLFVVSILGLVQISFKHDPLRWLPEHWESRQATHIIDVNMRGSSIIEIVVDTGTANGLYEPKVMNTLNEIHQKISNLSYGDLYIGKSVSIVDILKESNRALNENNETYYTIPQNKELIAQELLLFENSGSDDMEDFVDSQFSMARITIKTPWADAASNARMLSLIQKEINSVLGDSLSSYTTGMASLFARTMNAAIDSIRQSYVLAVLVIAIMMMALLGSLKYGLISIIPNLLPIVISMGLMGYLGMPLDLFTMLIGSISIGLVVDDTIHVMHNYQRYYNESGDVTQAVTSTLHSTGRAIVVTTVVLCFGFLIFTASSMDNLFRFGLITSVTIFLALLSDLLLVPALMKVIHDRKAFRSVTKAETA